MSDTTPITYMGFYDVPLIFITRYRGQTYLFDCPFDEELEDDSDSYKVYMLPPIQDDDFPRDWTTLHHRATRYLGEVLVASVRFDETHRKFVDSSALTPLIAQAPVAG